MGFASRGITAADILDAIVDDSTKFHGASIAAILADTDAKDYETLEFWGNPVANFVVNSTLNDFTLSDVAIPALTGKTIAKAYAVMRLACIRNSHAGSNQLNIASVIQADKAAAGWITAIEIPSNAIEVHDSERYPNGIMFMGEDDITSRVALGSTTNLRWYQARATETGIFFAGVQTGIRVLIY